jgi:aldehyde dehydrogenase (NAD+)
MIAEPAEVLARLRSTFRSGRTRPLAWRKGQLSALARFLHERETPISRALYEDLGRARQESLVAELALVDMEIREALAELPAWTRPERVRTPLLLKPASASVWPEPLGVVLVMGPWNYPLQLLLAPLVSALAAGNCAVLKPSEHAPATSALLATELPQFLDTDAVAVVEGDAVVSASLAALPFDHIFFTGGAGTGRKVLAAAASNLVPVTLELGGKSPAVVDASADLEVAGRRIAWGRFVNAGQTCVAPDYVLVERRVARNLVKAIEAAVIAFYGPDPRQSQDLGRIISEAHVLRLAALLEGQDLRMGGAWDVEDGYFAPTLVWDPKPSSPLMQEEIFGPILPILPVEGLDEAIAFVAGRPDPLALYLFSHAPGALEKLRLGTRSGAIVQNDTMVHLAVLDLPFGGLGPSGMGAYHGRTGFTTFSHLRPVLVRSTRIDPALRYPPYGEDKERWMRRLL